MNAESLSDRLLRVAMSGVIPADDPHVIADAVITHNAMLAALKDALSALECWMKIHDQNWNGSAEPFSAIGKSRLAIALADGSNDGGGNVR